MLRTRDFLRLTSAVGLLVLTLSASAEDSAPDAYALLAPLKKVVDAINRQDMRLPADAFAGRCSITDVIPPYHWSGAGAADSWYQQIVGLTVTEQKRFRDSNEHLTLSAPRFIRAEGDRVYFVVEATMDYADRDAGHRTIGLWTVSETKAGGRWLIESCSWGILRES